MSTHDHSHGHGHDSGGDHGGHGEPTGFFRKYVFSTDHKVIGIQFMFASLLFVIIGGLLALGVRYQLAWPNQNVPFKFLLPTTDTPGGPSMVQKAPEANVALWKLGREVEFTQATPSGSGEIPAGTKGRFTGFVAQGVDNAIAVTIPSGTMVRDEVGQIRPLPKATDGFVKASQVLGDYNYKTAQVRAVKGTQVFVPGDADGGGTPMKLELVSRTVVYPGARESSPVEGNVILAIRTKDTKVRIDIPSQTLKVDDKPVQVTAQIADAISAESVTQYKNTLKSDAYLTLFTMHASVMIFFVIIPMLVGGFGNFVVPIMVGARDMAFPKLNALSFWISVPAGIIMVITFWLPEGAAGGGWTMYPTLSSLGWGSPNLGTTLWIFGVALVGFSSVVGALNYITTIINMRAPGMTLFRMPLTVWSILITASLALFSTPVLTAAMIMLLLDRTLGTMFFTPVINEVVDGQATGRLLPAGGQPLLWQHLFWFYSHPAVYIMILPAMGVVSDVLATFSRKPIFGFKPMVFAICAIAGLGFIVWGHHMFQSGMNPILGTTFMASTIMIAVPSAIKTFNWLGTLWGGNIRFTPAMLNALGFVSMFVIGGLSGIFMASAPVDIHIHDTYFIVAHIHYVLFGGSMFGIFAGIYYWFPKMFGRQMNQKWGTIHFIMTIIAFNLTFFIMHILGVGGHPRRYASIEEYPTLQHLQPLNVVMTIGAMMLGMAQIPFFFNFFVSLPRKLGRAMTALFTIMLTTPAVIGLWFWNTYTADGTWAPVNRALWPAIGVGAAWIVAVIIAVFVIWMVGGIVRAPKLINALLYFVFIPAFLAPAILKHDTYLWLGGLGGGPGVVGLFEYRWIILLLTGLPGLAYFVAFRPKDEYGYAPGDNPWHANSLEWCTTSPPPFTNFEQIPVVYRGPYEYSSPASDTDYLEQDKKLAPGVVEPSGH